MIRVAPPGEPADFDERCRSRGRLWLEAHPEAKRPYPYWDEFQADLARDFKNRCAYLAQFVPVGGTVDHFLPWKEYRELAYEWSNYRFADSLMNQIKGTAGGILDPFEVQDDWFEIHLPSLQLLPTDKIPVHLREKANHTIRRLRLQDDERILRSRRGWYEAYLSGKLSLAGLRDFAPLIARAVERQQAG